MLHIDASSTETVRWLVVRIWVKLVFMLTSSRTTAAMCCMRRPGWLCAAAKILVVESGNMRWPRRVLGVPLSV
ncbi:unnamed protein product [Toxocara canis]|uniref:Secreted protein n=1 Tax=Toxocara canis TaxID=6265 RepID=A0A183UEP5_TOXCA|nr:unnamed protein product [Toxocara canis]